MNSIFVVLSFMLARCSTKAPSSLNQNISDEIWVKCKSVCVSCADCYQISNGIESDTMVRIELSKYIYKSLKGGYDCSKTPMWLFEKDSFKRIVCLIFEDKKMDVKYDKKFELLYNCENSNTTHEICNELLKKGNVDCLMALWDNINVKKLTHFHECTDSIRQPFQLMSLATICHNGKFSKEREQFLLKINNNQFESQIDSLQKHFSKNEYISEEFFNEIVFNGY